MLTGCALQAKAGRGRVRKELCGERDAEGGGRRGSGNPRAVKLDIPWTWSTRWISTPPFQRQVRNRKKGRVDRRPEAELREVDGAERAPPSHARHEHKEQAAPRWPRQRRPEQRRRPHETEVERNEFLGGQVKVTDKKFDSFCTYILYTCLHRQVYVLYGMFLFKGRIHNYSVSWVRLH